MEVLVLLDTPSELSKEIKQSCKSYLEQAGFGQVNGEDFTYLGKTNTSLIQTRTYILAIFQKVPSLLGLKNLKMLFQIGNNLFETYIFDELSKEFKKLEKIDKN